MNIHCTCGTTFKPTVIGVNVCTNKKCGKHYICKTIPAKKEKREGDKA